MAADGMDRCIGEVIAASGDLMTRAEASEALSLIDERAERLGREQGLSPADAARAAAEEAAATEQAAAAVEKRNALMNLSKRIGRRQAMDDAAGAVTRKGEPDLAHAAMNQVVARNAPTKGNRLSAEAVWKTRQADYAGGLAVGLQKAGLLKAFRNGQMERLWARELYELSMQSAGKDANVGVTKNAAALTIAKTVHGLQQLAKERLNREGAWIGDYAGYITRTTHDADKIRTAGFDAWRNFVMPRLSAETFEGVDNPDAMLRSAHSALVTGVHLSDSGQVGLKDPAFSGPANVGKKLSQGRTLHWNNADAWLDYQQRFGTGSLAEQVTGSLDRSARQEALMQRWGTNPEAEFKQDFSSLAERYRDTAPDAVVRLREQQHAIQKRFDYLTGEANRPVNKMAAEISSSIRAIQSMAKLGGVALTHVSSFVTKAAELRYQGVGFLEAYGNSISSLMQGRGRGEARELADLLLSGTEGMHGSMLSRFHADDALPGTISKLTNSYFKLSGLTYMLDAQKAGTQRLMARHLGRNIGREFEALPPEIQRSLTSYDISPGEWDTLRTAPDHTTVDGRVHLTPDAAIKAREPGAPNAGMVRMYHGGQPIDGEGTRWVTQDRRQAEGYAAKSVDGLLHYIDLPENSAHLVEASDTSGIPGAKKDYAPVDLPNELANQLRPVAGLDAGAADKLGMKLHALYSDVADRGIITPGIDERALLGGGARPGTLVGEAVRFISQFKTWGVAAARQGLGREIYGGQGVAGAVSGIVQMALGVAAMGYMTMMLKDLTNGKVPRNPTDPATIMAAMIQGGGFGIMGDYLFGEFGRFGQTALESLAGPTAGTISDIARLYSIARGLVTRDPNARPKDVGPEALRIVRSNTPFANLFWVRKALDYLVFHSLQESMNPGYLERAQRTLQKQTGQTYFMAPTNHLKTFGH